MKKKIILILSVSLFFTLKIALPTEKNAEFSGQSEEDQRKLTVVNTDNPIYEGNILELKEVFSFGGNKEKRDKYFWSKIAKMEIDNNGNFYILDIKQKNIKVFDKSGFYIKSIGRIGAGPGEFQYPWWIDIPDKRRIVILDMSRRNLLYYSLDGTFDKQLNMAPYGTCTKFIIGEDDQIIGEFSLNNGGAALKRVNLGTNETESIAKKEYERTPLLYKITPKLIWTSGQDNQILWSINDAYKINICDDQGNLIKIIKKPLKKLKIRNKKREEYQDQVQRIHGGRAIPINYQQELPKYYPAFQDIYTDDLGRIIIKTYEKNKDDKYYFDIFDPKGRYIAKIAMSSEYQIWRKDNLYTIELDKEGYHTVKKYKVKWKY